jgi:hypothetical protein
MDMGDTTSVHFKKRAELKSTLPERVLLKLDQSDNKTAVLSPALADGLPTDEGSLFGLSWAEFWKNYQPV